MLGQIIDGKVRAALFALLSVVAGARVYLARSWTEFNSLNPLDWPVFAQLGVPFVVLGLLLPELGGRVLRRWPLLGLAMIELRALWVLAVLASLTVLGLWLTELFAVNDTTEANVKTATEAVEKSVVAVLTALTVAVAGDSSASATAKTSKAKFQEAFKNRTANDIYDKQLEQAVFSETFAPPSVKNRNNTDAESAEGWDWDARWVRARTVAANLTV